MGIAAVRNTDCRVLELCGDLQEIVDAGSLGSKQPQRLRGRMQFAEAQVFGRTGRRCLKVLSSFAECHKQHLDAEDIFFLDLFKRLLQKQCPQRSAGT